MNDHKVLQSSKSEILFFSSPLRLTEALMAELTGLIQRAVAERGDCHMVFPGGRSLHLVMERLREQDIPWSALHLYPSDERCVPVGDPERNDRLIDELLFNYVPLPPENLHRIPAELGPVEGARRFSELLKRIPAFDIVVVGVGTDGHIASLFPNHPAVSDTRNAVPVKAAPKPPPSRVSIGFDRLRGGYNRYAVAIGAEKRDFFKDLDIINPSPVIRVNAAIWCAD